MNPRSSALPCDRTGLRFWWALTVMLALSPVRLFAEEPQNTVAVLEVRPDIYMLTAAGINVTLQRGADGAIVVDPGPAKSAREVEAAIARLVNQPVRFIINTSADPELNGANEVVSRGGQSFAPNQLGGAAPVIATQNTLLQMIGEPGVQKSEWALPSELFSRPQFSLYINRQPVAIAWLQAAHSNGDAVVRFESADVLSTGDVFDETRFPVIDVAHGGSVAGEVAALNHLINIMAFAAVPLVGQSAMLKEPLGTLVIPVRGPLSDQHDLVTYRDMVETVRERVEDLIAHGKDLAQVQAARPAQGFEARYGADSGDWTTKDFVAAVYESLRTEKNPTAKGKNGSQSRSGS